MTYFPSASDARWASTKAAETNNAARVQEYMALAQNEISKSIGVGKFEAYLNLESSDINSVASKIMENLTTYGYFTSFQRAEAGDCREPLDYGTPARIYISWKGA